MLTRGTYRLARLRFYRDVNRGKTSPQAAPSQQVAANKTVISSALTLQSLTTSGLDGVRTSGKKTKSGEWDMKTKANHYDAFLRFYQRPRLGPP